jgi:hypothetical protein
MLTIVVLGSATPSLFSSNYIHFSKIHGYLATGTGLIIPINELMPVSCRIIAYVFLLDYLLRHILYRSFYIFFGGLECDWPLHCLCSPLCIERCPDTNPESCRSKKARYQLSHPSPTLSHPSPSLSHPSPSLSLPSLFLCQPSPSLSNPPSSISHPTPSLSHPSPSHSHPSPYRSLLLKFKIHYVICAIINTNEYFFIIKDKEILTHRICQYPLPVPHTGDPSIPLNQVHWDSIFTVCLLD